MVKPEKFDHLHLVYHFTKRLKQKYARANNGLFMNKDVTKAIMN